MNASLGYWTQHLGSEANRDGGDMIPFPLKCHSTQRENGQSLDETNHVNISKESLPISEQIGQLTVHFDGLTSLSLKAWPTIS
jgi:hypothetical protein